MWNYWLVGRKIQEISKPSQTIYLTNTHYILITYQEIMVQNSRFPNCCTRRELRNICDFGNEIIFDAFISNYRKVSDWWVEEIHFKLDHFFDFLTHFLGLHDAAPIAGIRNYKMKTWVCTRPATTDQTWGRIWACNLSDTKTEAIQIFTIYVIWPYVVIEKNCFMNKMDVENN